MGTKPVKPKAFLAALQASAHFLTLLPAYRRFDDADCAFDTILPFLFFVNFA